jgi:CRP-like cAMP-binding protein
MNQFFGKGDRLFDAGHHNCVLQVRSGLVALEVSQAASDSSVALTQLALPGDVLGVESLCGEASLFRAVAWMPCEVTVLQPFGTVAEFTLISQSYLQQQRRLHDMTRLRTGTVRSRVGHLLEMLARDEAGAMRPLGRQQLPTMKEMAQIVDAAHETVCRELNHFLPTRKTEQRSVLPRQAWVGV